MDPRPCINVEDLWSWEPPGGPPRPHFVVEAGDVELPVNPCEVPPIEKLRRAHAPRLLPQLLVCHDYKGDIPLCDRWEGCATAECEPFLFTHWWHMDTFCYFGHKMVTIPPPAFTSLAHRHGVAVLGTLIFENDKGKAALSTILASDDAMCHTIGKVVEIMQTWQFEGWLLNVEVVLTMHQTHLLLVFISRLREATRAANPQATILWYDAVCTDGKLEWQNTLNYRNREFYNKADGIFINYAWKAADLDESRRYNRGAASVCIGVDVWGRSGGSAGWDTHEAVSKILRKGLSVALFAPGWAVEADENRGNGASVEENSNKFWNTFNHVVDTRPLDAFPFESTFRNGFSQDGKFFRLRDASLMPHLAHSKKQLVPTERGLLIKTPGKHLLWVVKMQSNSELRVWIQVQGSATVKIKLDGRTMHVDRFLEEDEDNGITDAIELSPMTNECLPVRAIYVVTSEPDTVLSYFKAFKCELKRCLI